MTRYPYNAAQTGAIVAAVILLIVVIEFIVWLTTESQ